MDSSIVVSGEGGSFSPTAETMPGKPEVHGHGLGPTRTQSVGAPPAPILIGPVDLPGALKGLAYFDRYQDGSPAVRITCTDTGNFETPYATFSLNLGENAQLRPWEFMANTWGENLHLGRTMALSPCFEPVLGVLVKRAAGYEIQTWRMKPVAMEEAARNLIAEVMGWPRSIEREPVRPSVEPRVARLAMPIDEDAVTAHQAFRGDTSSRQRQRSA